MKISNLNMPRQSKRQKVIRELNSIPDIMLEDMLKFMSGLKSHNHEKFPEGFRKIAEMKGKYHACKFSSEDFINNKGVEKSLEL